MLTPMQTWAESPTVNHILSRTRHIYPSQHPQLNHKEWVDLLIRLVNLVINNRAGGNAPLIARKIAKKIMHRIDLPQTNKDCTGNRFVYLYLSRQ
jgi:hypothetical protein